jgi:riboflavin kinase/FMN adenylyltransferase
MTLIRSAVLTFDRHPLETLDPPRAPVMLTTPEQRARRIAELGADILAVVPFDDAMRSMSAQAFAEDVLVRRMSACIVHVGEGFAFGRGRAGDTRLLRELGERLGFAVRVLPAVQAAGAPASSSRVRALLEVGDVATAADVLGRAFALSGVVVRGDGIGRQLGFPTANLQCRPRQATPADGVYATRVPLDGAVYPGACSIGTRPTLGGTARVIEVHLAGFSGDLYGRTLEVEFIRKLRDQERYERTEDLIAQIADDVRATCALMGT